VPTILWILIGVSAAATLGFFVAMAAAEMAGTYRSRQQARFRAECDAARDEAERALRPIGRVPSDWRAA
jgi:hypothetical protein